MGQRIIHCGASGSGLAAKICNNLVLGVQQIVVAEAMLLGQRLGLDPVVLASVINNSTGSCWSSSVNNPVPGALPEKSPPCERDFDDGFATALMIKVSNVIHIYEPVHTEGPSRQDLGLATEVSKSSGSPVPLGEAAESIYADAVKRYPELLKKDFSSVYRYLEKRGRKDYE